MRRIRRPSHATVVAYLALFVALGGGTTAVALNGQNTVQSDDLGPGAQVKAADVAANAVNSSDVVDGSITGSDVNEAGLDATPLATRAAQGGCSAAVAGTGIMVKVGSICIDRYEASVWSSPTGGTQFGTTSDNYPCKDNGQNCTNLYARSVPGVKPSAFITWFQAQQALANSGKSLPTNAQWQMAVAGTPDGAACNLNAAAAANTGSFGGCASNHGANDMVGNLQEWVADWDEETEACDAWPAAFGSDATCLGRGSGDEASTRFPGALVRGGAFAQGSIAGPFAVTSAARPSISTSGLGFRGAR